MIGTWRRQAGITAARRAWGGPERAVRNSANPTTTEEVPLLERGERRARQLFPVAVHFLWRNHWNILLPIVPATLVVTFLELNPVVVFVLNFIAIMQQNAILSDSMEELAAHVGPTFGGLLNTTLGNATELMIGIFALLKGEIRIVQAIMLGSVLSRVLLILGLCFFLGGVMHKQQRFNNVMASTMASLMLMSSSSLCIPAALYQTLAAPGPKAIEETKELALTLSRRSSIAIIGIYVMFIYFRLQSHYHFFVFETEEEEHPNPILTQYQAAIILLLSISVVAFCSKQLVGTIDSIAESTHLSKTFIGLILIPFAGNAAEHVTSVAVAMEGNMSLAVNTVLGSSVRIALLITPLLVLLGWAIGQPMSLYFQTFETVVFFISVLLSNCHIQDGKSSYLDGAMLVGFYIIVAASFYIYPDSMAKA